MGSSRSGTGAQIELLDARIEQLIGAIPAARVPPTTGNDGDQPSLPPLKLLDEITGIGRHAAQEIIAEVGRHGRLPDLRPPGVLGEILTTRHQIRRQDPIPPPPQRHPHLLSVLGEAAATAARTRTFLGAGHRRLARRAGKLEALVAVARSILVIVC